MKRSADELIAIFRSHGVVGEVREILPREGDEAVFVVTAEPPAADDLTIALQSVLKRKVWVVPWSEEWHRMSEPLHGSHE